ncbi:MAG: hypothetical protein AB8B77_07980 [Alphaproteobacteria bacterium]
MLQTLSNYSHFLPQQVPLVLILMVILLLLLIILIAAMAALLVMVRRLKAQNIDIKQAVDSQETWLKSTSEAPNEMISSLRSQLKKQAALLTETAILVANDIEQTCNRIDDTGERMQTRAKESARYGEDIHEMLVNTVTRMDGMNKALQNSAESLETRVIGHVETMSGETKQLSDLVESIDQTTQRLEQESASVQTAVGQCDDEYRRIADDLRINGSQFVDQLDEATKHHQHEAEQSHQKMQQVIAQLQDTKQALNTEASAIALQIESQRGDLAATAAQAKKGSEALGALLDEKLNQITHTNEEINGRIGNSADNLQRLHGGLNQMVEHLSAHAIEIEQRLFTHSEDAVAKLGHHVQGYIEAVNPVLQQAHGFAERMDMQTQQLGVIGNQAEAQSNRLGEMLNASNSLQTALDQQLQKLDQLKNQLELARQSVQEITEGSVEALENTGKSTSERARQVGEFLNRHAQALTKMIDDVSGKLSASGSEFSKQIGSLNEASGEALAHLDQFAQRLDMQSERLTSSSVAAGLQFSDHQSMLENLSVRLTNVANDTGELLGDALTAFQKSEDKLSGSQEKIMQGWEKIAERMRLQIEEINEIHQHADLQLNNINEGLSGQRDWLQQTIDFADGGLSQLLDSIRDESVQLSDVMDQINAHVGKASLAIDQKIVTLNETGKASLDQALAVRDQYEVESRDLFNRTSRHIIEDLNSISIDLTRALEGEVPEADWRRYIKGDRTIFSRTLLRNRQDALIRKIAERVRGDNAMRGYVSRYVELFDQLLKGASKSDSENLLHATFLTSDVGKLYVILNRALGKEE